MRMVNENLKVIMRKKIQDMMRIMKAMIMRSNPMKMITTALFLFMCLVLLLQKKRMGSGTIFPHSRHDQRRVV